MFKSLKDFVEKLESAGELDVMIILSIHSYANATIL